MPETSLKRVKAKYPGTCRKCKSQYPINSSIIWGRTGGYHERCAPQPFDDLNPGGYLAPSKQERK